MGKKSTRENKTIYMIYREEQGLSREKASELLNISADRLERIESEKCEPRLDEVRDMATVYERPELINTFCADFCPIGQLYVPKVEMKDLSQIVLEMLSTLNHLNRQRERLIDITVDGEISEDEVADFAQIQSTLEQIKITVSALELWAKKAMPTT